MKQPVKTHNVTYLKDYRVSVKTRVSDMDDKHGLKCPRCDSRNTKFCYYNNYTKSQPRHYCKSCKKHWTKDGILRNVTKKRKVIKNKRTSMRMKKKMTSRCPIDVDVVGEGLRQKMDDTQLVIHQKDESFSVISTGFDQSHDLFDDIGFECSSLFDQEMFSFKQLPCVSDNDLKWEDLLLYETFCVTDFFTMDDDVPGINSAIDFNTKD